MRLQPSRDQKFGLQLNASLILSVDSASRSQSPNVSNGWQYLLKVDHTEQAVRISVRASGEEQLIGFSVHASAFPEGQRPKATDADDLVARILELSYERSGRGIERIDAAVADVSN